MIGSALKKLAAENGLTISGGIAYGNYQGYAITLSEGAGYKLLTVSTHLTDTACNWLNSQLSGHNLMKEFRVEDIQLSETGAVIVFNDNPGTMKRFHEFLQWFFPLLPQAGATGYDCCCGCGQPFNGDETWKKAGDTPMHLHTGCAQSLLRDVQQEEEAEQKTGSYGKGLIGALLGESTEYFDATMANLVEGLLFALIGMAGMLYRTYKETKKFKMKDMR